MKDLKFRAWDAIDKKWLFYRVVQPEYFLASHERLMGSEWSFTYGATDNDGREIYTGDILEDRHYDNDTFYGVVEFENGSFVVKEPGFKYEGSNDDPMYLNEWLTDGCIIIGNIFEDKDLLTKLKNYEKI